jgi:UDP-2,3-diacylglucosamine pyrophosphatase LpxH
MTDYNFDKLQGETKFRHLVRLAIAKLNKEHPLDWLELVDMFNLDYSAETLRKKSYGWKDFIENEELEKLNTEEEITYKETTEILSNGSHKSDKLVRMTAEQSKDVNYLLASHGFDDESWELVNAKNNIWNVHSKQDGVQTLYSSKITVKPKTNAFDFNKFLELISKKVEPITIEKKSSGNSPSKLLEISLYDMHFGVSSLEYYKNHLHEIVYRIQSRSWKKILFVIGQDLLHNDNFKGQTANGTFIEKVNMEKAFNEALKFYVTLITEAMKHSESVECRYVKGNHDESISYGFFRTLQATFPQVEFVGNLKQRTAFTWEKIFIGLTHGDKGANRIVENFISEYGKLIAHAEVKEIHAGHIHTEKSNDNFGIMKRSLSTANKTDDWHDDNGFIGANKRFQLFEYSPNSLDAIYYVQ